MTNIYIRDVVLKKIYMVGKKRVRLEFFFNFSLVRYFFLLSVLVFKI